MKAIFRRPVLIPFGITMALMLFQQLSGIDAIIFNTVSIFDEAGSSVEDHLAAILVGVVQLVANIGALFVVDRAGRRPLLLISGALMTISMAALGAYFHLKTYYQVDTLGALPLASLLVFMLGFSVGYCTLPYLLMGELLPELVRGPLSSVAGSVNLGIMFVVIKSYHDIKTVLGDDITYWIYGSLCLLSCFFVAFLVPETRGKSLDEIEEYYENKNIKRRDKQKRIKENMSLSDS